MKLYFFQYGLGIWIAVSSPERGLGQPRHFWCILDY